MFSEKEYIKAIGIISCYLNCDEMSTEEFNDSIVVINDLINEYFEIIEEKERLEKALYKACEFIKEAVSQDCTIFDEVTLDNIYWIAEEGELKEWLMKDVD